MGVPRPKALIVEDEPSLLLAIQKKLHEAGFEVVAARDGEEALSALEQSERVPNLIWLDYYLPKMNGIEFLSAVKKQPRLRDIPVIVVSNTAGPEKVSSLLAMGADRYFVKAEQRLTDIISEAKAIAGGGG